MNDLDRYVIKTALQTLNAAGGCGLLKKALLDQIDLAAGAPTTDEQREAAFALLEERGWMTSYLEPIWHKRRYTITERGLTALESM